MVYKMFLIQVQSSYVVYLFLGNNQKGSRDDDYKEA